MKKSHIPKNLKDSSKLQKNAPETIKPFSQVNFIHLIFQNNFENKIKIKNIFLQKKFSLYKKNYFPKLFFKTNYISKTSFKYKISLLYAKKYLNTFIYSILFIIEENKKYKGQLHIFLDHYLIMINKLYKEKIIDDVTLLIIIKFIIYLSIYERNTIPETNLNKQPFPKLRTIKNYSIFKISIEIIKIINEINITKEYINFIKEEIITYKNNLYIITKRVDMLELINLNDKKEFIIEFLAKLYSFKYSKLFLDVFIKKINDVYDIKNNDKKTIDILKFLNRDLALLNLMQKIENKRYKEDPFVLSNGFVISNNNKATSIILKEIIVKENFTMVFSFCYSPDKKDNKLLDESINKGKLNKNIDIDKIPIIELIKEEQSYNEITGFSFFIKDDYLYHRKYNESEEMKLFEIKENETYICYYSIKEHDHFMINIKGPTDLNTGGFFHKENIKFLLKNKLKMQVGKFFNSSARSFDGYMGPIILFNCCLPNECRRNIFGLKGSYEKMLYFGEYNYKFLDKYDKDVNCPFLNNPKDEINNFLCSRKALIDKKIDIKEKLIYYLTPIYEGSTLNKKEFIHSTLKECRISFFTNPKPECSFIFFFKNVFTPFEFLKYEGINFLVLIFELIVSNVDNIEKDDENERIVILNMFSELIPYIQDLIYIVNVDFYEDELRHILFALEKCVNKICKKFKMCSEIGHQLNSWIRSLTTQDSPQLMSYIRIRNEITKFLLDTELYDMNEYSCIEFFFSALNFCINKMPDGLINMEILQKILTFTDIFKIVTKQKNIRKSRQFKSFKIEMIKVIITFLKKSQFITPYVHIYQIISDNILYDFRKYQLLKIFYLESKFYFDNIPNDKVYISTWKYFISLFKYLQSCNSLNEITQKQANIIMALCLRMIIEYPIVGNFFKENKYKNKKTELLLLKKKQKSIRTTLELGSTLEDKIKWTSNPILPKKAKLSKRNSVIFVDAKEMEKEMEKEKENKGKEKEKNNKNKRSNSAYKSFKYKIEKNGIKISNIETKENQRKNSFDSLEIIKNQKQNELNQNIDFFALVDFFTFKTLFDIIESKYKINDYIFRALLLLILETNNNVTISQEIKLKFITKVKKYEHLKHKDYAPFLKLSYINRETKSQLIKLVNMVSKNVDNITHITYDIFLYLIIKTCQARKENKCVFNHLIRSKKICSTLFITALNHNKEANDLISKNFLELTNLILPYHKKPFLTEFLYEVLTTKLKNLRGYGQILVNMMLLINLQDIKEMDCFYHIKLNLVILLYRVIKSKDYSKYANELNFTDTGLVELFNDELVSTKINIFKDVPGIYKKKCYAEVLYEIMLFLCIYSKKEMYYSLICQMFIMYIQHFKKTNKENSKTIVYYLDEIKGQGEKANKALKIFIKPENLEVPCLSVQFLLKTLKYQYRCIDQGTKNLLISLASSFYTDAYLMFSKHSSKKKKYKNKVIYNFLYELIKADVSKKTESEIEKIAKTFNVKYSEYLEKKRKKLESTKKKNEDGRNRSVINLPIKDFDFLKNDDDIDDLNDSFSSCKSTKEIKNTCALNQKKVCRTMNKRKNFVKKIYKKIDKEDPFDTDDEEDPGNSSLIQGDLPKSELEFTKNLISTNPKKENTPNILFNINSEVNPFSLEKIETMNKVILFPKSTLIEEIFAIYFIERLFYNKPFIKMRQYFKYYVKKHHNTEIETKVFFNYPIIMKNYISNNLYFGGLFLKHDLDFFNNRYFNISHSYFKEKLKDSIQKRIFPKISDQDDINKFLKDNSNEKKYIFYVDLVTNRNVVFGKLIFNKYLLYFENVDRNKFLKEKKDDEKIDWLLCSQECDYSPRNKKLYIFKKEITEIINRRFLYSFQACEIYLKNGKSYYFNFYSEEKKISFISLFADQAYDIKILSDLKSEFKNKGFTKLWLNNKISTLAYLLFINKYSCRSYNDVNQYPVFPWLILYGEKERDMRYTITAQDEDTRMLLKEKYPFSSEHFPYHYTTHYSNASFLIYYLIRINPFTDNQITLQVNKFDVPDRQFNSLDEIQKILYTTKQPREVIPEFFMSTEFFYNYNCNYFGVKNNTNILVNDLINKKNFKSPLEFVLNNEVLLESPKFKSQINFFFDNIFGVGQMGGCEKCNTYDKYSYQEMVDLNQKIKKFRDNKLSYEEIKNKIASKSNKIISFGQTPFKLFEDKHPPWVQEKGKKEDELKIDENFNDMKERFIYFNFAENNNKKQVFYILVNNEHMSEIKFYDNKIKNYKEVIKTKKRLKLCSKLYLDNFKNKNFVSLYKYNPKFIMINFNFMIFIFGRLKESCLCIFNKEGESISYFIESMVISIAKSKGYKFFTGLENGKILEFKLDNFDPNNNNNAIINLNDLQINLIRSYIAHKKRVSGIYYSDLLGLIISSGDDRKIFIRKYYDLSLLTVINIEHKFCIDIKINHYYLYILLYNEENKKHIVEVRSVNGLVVAKTDYNLYNNIDFDKDGNLLIGYAKDLKIVVYNPALTKQINEIDLNQLTLVTKKKKETKEIKNEDTFFLNFTYQGDNSCIYCYFSNGKFIQKYLEYPPTPNK